MKLTQKDDRLHNMIDILFTCQYVWQCILLVTWYPNGSYFHSVSSSFMLSEGFRFIPKYEHKGVCGLTNCTVWWRTKHEAWLFVFFSLCRDTQLSWERSFWSCPAPTAWSLTVTSSQRGVPPSSSKSCPVRTQRSRAAVRTTTAVRASYESPPAPHPRSPPFPVPPNLPPPPYDDYSEKDLMASEHKPPLCQYLYVKI